MTEIGETTIGLKYWRLHQPHWEMHETVEAAVAAAHVMTEYNLGAPYEVVTLGGELLLDEKALDARVGEYGDAQPEPQPVPPPQPISAEDLPAATAFSEFMGRAAADASDWAALSGPLKALWRGKVAAASDHGADS